MNSKIYPIFVQYNIFWWLCLPLFIGMYSCADQSEPFDFFEDGSSFSFTSCPPNVKPSDVLALLINDLDALCILQQDFYLRTNELNQRSLLDYDLFLPLKFACSTWDIGAHFFYNQTTRDNYTRTSTNLCSYLAIFNETLLQELQQRIEQSGANPAFDLRAVVPLFRNMTVQERRTGFMFQGMYRFNNYRFRFLFPLYYNEVNFFLTPEEIDAIETALGVTDPVDNTKVTREHLVADKIGIGDLRLELDMPLARTGSVTTKVGIFGTVPTAFAFKKGLYGTHFQKICSGPVLSFCNIFDLIINEDLAMVKELADRYAFAAFDHFAANLIDTPMGNGGHFGLGLYTRSKTKLSTLIKRPWAERITMYSRIAAEYLFPHKQRRYFIEASDRAGFAALGLDRNVTVIIQNAEDDPTYANEVLSFLEHQFTERVFPFALPVTVRPGMIFRWATKYQYETRLWGYYIGTDTWLTTKEKLYNIEIPQGVPVPLNVQIAQKPFGYQVGVMGSFFWKLSKNRLFSLNGQYNFTSLGIGYDYLISCNLECFF